MSDESILLDILKQTLEATRRVIKRFEPVDSVSFFTESDAGMKKLDAICMLLIAIGESLKKIDAEEIYWVCEKQITELSKTIQLIITDVSNEDSQKINIYKAD